MKKFIQTLWSILLFSFPFSLRYLWIPDHLNETAAINHWSSHFIYAPELLLITTYLLYLIFHKKKLKRETSFSKGLKITIGLFIVNGVLVNLLNSEALAGIIWVIRIMEIGMVIQLFKAKLIPLKKEVNYLIGGLIFQVTLGFFQWILNQSIGLKWLGESILNEKMTGVAKVDLKNGSKQIRAYGTFLHPNIFAAYLITLLGITIQWAQKKRRLLFSLLISIGLLLTHSHAAYIALLMFFPALFIKKNQRQKLLKGLLVILLVLNIGLFIKTPSTNFKDPSIDERLAQIKISQQITKENPWGIGSNQFTKKMSKNTEQELKIWQYQPVHNAYYLILNELGIQGLILLITLIGLFICQSGISLPLLTIIALGSFDHLFWTSWTGLILIGITIGITRKVDLNSTKC